MSGDRRYLRIEVATALLAGLGAAVAIFALAAVQGRSGLALLVPSFGASCALVFAVPESPFSRPRNLIGGHLLSSAVGFVALAILGQGPVAMAAGVGIAIIVMMLTKTMHPPAGGDPLIIILLAPPLMFLAMPIVVGTVLIAVFGLLWRHALSRMRPG